MSARYTLVLGTKNWSSWSLRPYLAMRATGVPFEEINIQLRHTQHPTSREQILRHSPAGFVPILKIADGGETTTVWDSLAICETLAERHPEAQLWPQSWSRRAEARSYAAEMHSGFSAVRRTLTMEFARRIPTPELDTDTKQQIARIIEAWDHALTHHSNEEGFLFGHFSIADCMYGPVASRFITYGIALPDRLKAYCERMMALPAMKDWGAAAQKEVDAGLA